MATFTGTGTAVNEAGISTPFSFTINTAEPVVINSVTVTPQMAAPGTLRTITVVATDPQGQTVTLNASLPGYTVTKTGPSTFTVVV